MFFLLEKKENQVTFQTPPLKRKRKEKEIKLSK
jgi:hypothetical protein